MPNLLSINMLEDIVKEKLDHIENLNESERVFLSMCRRELALLKKIDSEVDLTGPVDELEERLKDSSVYIINTDVFNELLRKSRVYDTVDLVMKRGLVINDNNIQE